MTRLLDFTIEHYLVVPLAALAAIVWANLDGDSYFRVAENLAFAVNDVGMAFALALLMQDVLEAMLPGGTLYPPRRALLPLVAAAGGLVGAIAMYVAWIRLGDEPLLALGWPIACAVDIIFTYVIARATFGRHPAVTFLLLVGIASNAVGLILISVNDPAIDTFPAALGLLLPATAGAVVLRHRTRTFWPTLLSCGTLSWLACYWGGLHPALALLPIVPFFPHAARRLDRGLNTADRRHASGAHFEYVFRYPVQIVLLLFGLINGGVLVRGFGAGTWAVLTAGLIGRPVGILAATVLGLAAGLHLPARMRWRDVVIVACIASCSVTFGLFFSSSIYPPGSFLMQTSMGALATVVGPLATLAVTRLLGVVSGAPRRDLGVLPVSRR